MSDTSKLSQCPKCGGPIPPEAPQGLCPKCLLAQASIPTENVDASPRPTPPPLADLASAFPQLEIIELIGQGGMGFVYKARQPKLERFVALKILPQASTTDARFAERFTREGRLLARLNHPNIVTVHDFGQANGFFYLLMEYVDGVNLRQAMRAGRFTPEQALAVVPKICDALQFAHNEGILHRDIKPENILLDSRGRLKIADFGIAKLIGEPQGEAHLTASGGTLGTPHYMAPEQVETPSSVDHRADIYSLGVVFYEMLTGELPLGKFQPPSQKVQVDVRLDDVVLHALEKEPSRRYQQVSEVKTAVDSISANPGSATPPPVLAGASRPALGFALKAGLAGFLLTALASMLFTLNVAHSHPGGWIFLATAVGVVVGGLIAIFAGLFSAWRSLGSRSVSASKPDLFWRRFAVGVSSFVLALVLIPMVTIFLAMLVPAYFKARNARSQAVQLEKTAREAAMFQQRGATNFLIGQAWFPKGDSITIDSVERSNGQMLVKGTYNLVSADKANLALEITSKVQTGERQDPRQSMEIVRGTARFTLFHPHVVPGMPHLNMHSYGVGFGELYFGNETEAAEEKKLALGMDSAERSGTDAKIDELKRHLRDLQTQGYKDPHPLIVTLRGQIAALERSIAEPKAETEPGPKLFLNPEQFTRSNPEPGQLDWGFKAFVPPDSLATFLFVVWSNGVPRIEPAFSTYFKVGKVGGVDLAGCLVSCYHVGESRWLGGLDESEKVKKLAAWKYQDPAGSTNAVRWDVSLGGGATVSSIIPMPPNLGVGFSANNRDWTVRSIKSMPLYHRISTSLPQSLESGHQLRFPLIEFDQPTNDLSDGWSGVDLRIFLEPLRIPAIRLLPQETDMTNYVAARGLVGTVDEALAKIKDIPISSDSGFGSAASQLENRNLRSIQLQETRRALDEALQKYIEPHPIIAGLRKRLDWIETGKVAIETNFFIGKTSFPYGDSITIDSVERDAGQMLVKGRYELVSADQASLALYVTSRNGGSRLDDAREKISISKGSGQFALYHPTAVVGLPNISMYSSNLTALAEVYFGNKREAAQEKDLILNKSE
jgi:serine/threonine protein kinase